MRNTRIFPLLLLSLLLTALLLFLTRSSSHAEYKATDGARSVPPTSSRLIVELAAPSLSQAYKTMVSAAAADGTLQASSPDAQAYIAQIQAEQAAFVGSLQAALPNVSVSSFINELGVAEQATYQVVMNGIAIDVGDMNRELARAQIERMPGVKAVYLDRAYEPQLYTSTTLIGATTVWQNLGGEENAGEGIRFASMDGGIHKDAPMFSGEGYSYPNGYGPNGLGLTSNNNGKIIASRVYFRPWDPPAPGDENPWPGVNGTSHGVHTASTAAGNCVDNVTYVGFNVGHMCGVAPRAYVMSYRVFYYSINGIESFYTTEGLAALEDIVRDGAQVLNNSWGAGPTSEGGEFDVLDTALANAAAAGVFVSMSNGNAGPGLGTSDHPSADYINVAASTTSGTLASGRLGIAGPGTVPDENKDFEFATADFGEPLPIGASEVYSYVPASVVDPANVEGCNSFPPNAFIGKAALIMRGTCEFGVKVLNAENAGAVFVVIYNHAAGGDGLINMGAGAVGNQVTISSVFIGNTNGQKLVNWYTANGPASTLEFNSIAFQAGNTPDEIIAFSSRGPSVGNNLKPDIAAPGVNILAQGYAPEAGSTGEDRHLGYGQASGTSMAAPHVAGASILLRQIYPSWTNAEIKSALMSTAKYLDMYTVAGDPAQPLDMGAGRLDVAAAVDPGVILDPPSLSYGLVMSGTSKSITVSVRNITGAAETYNLTTLYTGDGFAATTSLPGFTVSPASLTLAPGETKTFSVTLESALGRGHGDNQGYIVLDGSVHDAHLPAWARVTHAQPLADVLIIDNDFSSELGNPDYLAYYTDALDDLGLTYNVVDTADGIGGENTIPDATTLLAYKAVIFMTGDNYLPDGTFPVSTGLTGLDMDRLVEFLNSGGSLIAMGQDLSAALNADATDDTSSFFYTYRLGANWIQDSITNDEVPSALIIPATTAPEVFQDVAVDLTQASRYTDADALTGGEETPVVITDLEAQYFVTYDVMLNEFEFEVTIMTPTVPITITGAHIHQGAFGEAGPVVRSLDLGSVLPVANLATSLTLTGTIADLTTAEVDALFAGNIYINVHTNVHPAGEVRGQINLMPDAAQIYMDEVDNEFHDGTQDPDPNSPDNLHSVAILKYPSAFALQDGTVGLANRDQPSLERPGISYHGRSIYATFGLEGVNDPEVVTAAGPDTTTRAELLGRFLNWTWSEPGTPVISSQIVTPSKTAIFTATLESATAAANGTLEAVAYRWDFGDGSAYIASNSPDGRVGHTYQCAEDNTHTVRVEIMDQNGNVAIGSQEFDASQVCFTEPRTERFYNLPIIGDSGE